MKRKVIQHGLLIDTYDYESLIEMQASTAERIDDNSMNQCVKTITKVKKKKRKNYQLKGVKK